MPSKEIMKRVPTNKLFQLLNINNSKEELDGSTIIEEVRQNPQSTAKMYRFTENYANGFWGYPLHHVIYLGAGIDVVEAIYDSCPKAIEEKCDIFYQGTVLHLALHSKSPIEVALFLLNKFPEGARETDYFDNVPLFYACSCLAPIEVTSRLLKIWPDAVRAKNRSGYTPLIGACHHSPVEIITLLLEYSSPQDVRERNIKGQTALHRACCGRASLEVILLLLEKWPEGIKEYDNNGKTPLDIYEEYYQKEKSSEEKDEGHEQNSLECTKWILKCVFRLCGRNSMDKETSKEMMNYFIKVEWWGGVFLLFDKYPSLKQHLDIDTKIFPEFLSVLGRRCRMKTLWHMIINELDIMEGINHC